MDRGELLQVAEEAIDLGKAQQKQYRDGRFDNGKRDAHSLFTNVIFWKYIGVINHQLGKLADILIHAHSPEDLHKRRVYLLSVVFSFIDRFASLPTESSDPVDSKSNLPVRGINRVRAK